ncbi:MAG: iron-sulfur cluster assembly accessory protein [Pseudomonadota bacterium]
MSVRENAYEGIIVTPTAIKQIQALRTERDAPTLALRVIINSGGCAGFLCTFTTEETPNLTPEMVVLADGLVLTDKTSAALLVGTEIDYVDELIGTRFEVVAPKGRMGCSCGQSLSL